MWQLVEKNMMLDIGSKWTEGLIVAVNTKGKPGKGQALQFAQKFPDWAEDYKTICSKFPGLRTGYLTYYEHITSTNDLFCIVNFPTKIIPSQPSKLEWIEAGLIDFSEKLVPLLRENKHIYTWRLPLLGCGLGGLDFENQVRPLYDKYLNDAKLWQDDFFVYKYPSSPEPNKLIHGR